MKQLFILTALLGMAFGAHTAEALSLAFVEATGVVGPNDSIPVVVRIANNTGSNFNFDGNDPAASFGLSDITVPMSGVSDLEDEFGIPIELPFDALPIAALNFSFTCSGSFTSGGTPPSPCSPGDSYEFSFSSNNEPFFADVFSLDDGDFLDFEFGLFSPLGGGAEPGNYDFFGVTMFLDLLGYGYDENGQIVDLFNSISIASTCTTGDVSCAFSRSVVSTVPLPAAAWLFLTAVGGLVGVRRRRQA